VPSVCGFAVIAVVRAAAVRCTPALPHGRLPSLIQASSHGAHAVLAARTARHLGADPYVARACSSERTAQRRSAVHRKTSSNTLCRCSARQRRGMRARPANTVALPTPPWPAAVLGTVRKSTAAQSAATLRHPSPPSPASMQLNALLIGSVSCERSAMRRSTFAVAYGPKPWPDRGMRIRFGGVTTQQVLHATLAPHSTHLRTHLDAPIVSPGPPTRRLQGPALSALRFGSSFPAHLRLCGCSKGFYPKP